ncbi:MAG: catalase, partial [Clostridia bacterium]|nr:catalase [Clostridia bacterium]
RCCVRAGIPFHGLRHDLSKYSPTEFIPGVRYFQGVRSPNEKEREKFGYSAAWMHHKGRNRHHFEYWNDYDPVTKKLVAVPMPKKWFVEMFCDRVAASKTYKKEQYTDRSPLEYYLHAKHERLIHPDTKRDLEFFLNMLADEGEKKTFDYIKNVFLKSSGSASEDPA